MSQVSSAALQECQIPTQTSTAGAGACKRRNPSILAWTERKLPFFFLRSAYHIVSHRWHSIKLSHSILPESPRTHRQDFHPIAQTLSFWSSHLNFNLFVSWLLVDVLKAETFNLFHLVAHELLKCCGTPKEYFLPVRQKLGIILIHSHWTDIIVLAVVIYFI